MRGVILNGTKEQKNLFILDYVTKNKIRPYNIFRYAEELKIADAKEIRKKISKGPLTGEKNIFVIEQEVSAEVQNTLLKTLEELPDSAEVFFFAANLLPTVLSRCSEVSLGNSVVQLNNDHSEKLEKLISKKPQAADLLLFSDQMLLADTITNFDDLILSVRALLPKYIENKESSAIILLNLLKSLNAHSVLIDSNNLNLRITLEKILFECFLGSKLPS